MDFIDIFGILEKHDAWIRSNSGGKKADLTGANLTWADLTGANLSKALNIDTLLWGLNTAFYLLQCPKTGAYTAYQKAKGEFDCRVGNPSRRAPLIGHKPHLQGQQSDGDQYYGYRGAPRWRPSSE